MVGKLLLRGMLVGVVAAFLSFAFLRIVGEPRVDRAIAFETRMDEAMAEGMPMPKDRPEPELVSRPVQAGLGLFTGVSVYNVAFGGLFALAFALTYRRAGGLGPRATSAVLAAAGFTSLHVVPNLKYPASPPSVGNLDTIGLRTGLYFGMVLISLVGMIAAGKLRVSIVERLGGWNAAILAGAFYAVAMLVASFLLPGIDEVPEQFPAVLLWQFRMASFGAQMIMWTTMGLLFGIWAESLLAISDQGGSRSLRASI